MTFVEANQLWSKDQLDAAERVRSSVERGDIEVIRFAFPDQHGILRGKTLVASEALGCLEDGCSITSTLLAKDTSHRTVFPVFSPGGGLGMPELQGGADLMMVPDPTTFKLLPWAGKTGWLLCDLYLPNGQPVPFASRNIMRTALHKLQAQGYDFIAGLEVECHIFRLEDRKMQLADSGQPGEPPQVSLLSHGYQYLTEQRYDEMEPIFEIIRRHLLALEMPLHSIEIEYGPSQFEFTFRPLEGLNAADLMVLFRASLKQICARHGYHVTFMCRPRIPNVMSSGWHLHQSIVSRPSGKNAFSSHASDAVLSTFGKHYLAGLLCHARAFAVFTTPTLNGYKRYRPYSLAPDRASWGCDNRGAMLRVLGKPGSPATRIENRVGEPAANPYLYMASQIYAGLDGVERGLEPCPSSDTPYETKADMLPRSLLEAVIELERDEFARRSFSEDFIDYYTFIKKAEISRFQMEVTEWEHKEYFNTF